MPVFRENKSFCNCIEEGDKKLSCVCGEFDFEPVWKWDENRKTPTTLLSENGQKVYFHKGYSIGNACVRGDTPFTYGNEYYWEIKMCSNVYGTSMMVGIATESFNINQLSEEFRSLLGCDSESWGLKYNGTLHHNNLSYAYNPVAGFTIGSIIGVHLNMWNGTLQFYLNRLPLGLAFTGLKNKVLYPMVSSTASHTVMKLIYAHSEPHSLSLMAVKYLNRKLLNNLPPGLTHYTKNSWWLFPKSKRLEEEKKVQSFNSINLLTDSDSDSESDIDSACVGDSDSDTEKKVKIKSNPKLGPKIFNPLHCRESLEKKWQIWLLKAKTRDGRSNWNGTM